jgi:hypothetical protein
MPKLVPYRLAAACALALILALSLAAGAAAKGPLAELRVVGKGGKVLAERSHGAFTASVKASPKADCFGPGTEGSGKEVTVKGPTALGLLINVARSSQALKPLLITDAFDFGLGICGVGGSVASSKASWYLKVNHKNPELGGEMVKVKTGDEVLWALASFPYPDELVLSAPEEATAGEPFPVRVFAYDDKGKRKPAAGAKVTGAASPTGADGRTTVVLKKAAKLTARHGSDIPSAVEAVCVGGKCPRG